MFLVLDISIVYRRKRTFNLSKTEIIIFESFLHDVVNTLKRIILRYDECFLCAAEFNPININTSYYTVHVHVRVYISVDNLMLI